MVEVFAPRDRKDPDAAAMLSALSQARYIYVMALVINTLGGTAISLRVSAEQTREQP